MLGFASRHDFAKAAQASFVSALTLVLRGLRVCPPIVLDQRLELDLQLLVFQKTFGEIAAAFERAAMGQRVRSSNV